MIKMATNEKNNNKKNINTEHKYKFLIENAESHANCSQPKVFYQPASIHRAQLDHSYLYRFHVESHAIVRR